jgi:hypothetical protein
MQSPSRIAIRRIAAQDGMITVEYPVVKGLKSAIALHRINLSIKQSLDKLMEDQGLGQEGLEMIGWFEIKNNQRGILSLTLGNYAYPYHAAHGMTVIKGLTYNTDTGDSYSLASLFKPGADYVKALSDIVAQQIKDRNIELLGEFEGISPEQDFYIADKSLVLFFQLYEITPYYMGLQYFPISVYQIQNIILEDGPLGIMAIGN